MKLQMQRGCMPPFLKGIQMHIRVFGLWFKSKRELASLLGCKYKYSPTRKRGKQLPTREWFTESDLMARFDLKDKKQARQWLKAKIEEQQNASIDD